ncbi:MAG: hypothetical protein KAW12_15745 [Candidatus Aminicenantes bacterium]|nr:hypothetical protein [Candidatus Aminicenantes bacterium]
MDILKKNFKLFMAEIIVIRYPVFEQWVFLLFCISLVIQVLTGFFFTLFMTRAMSGFPVLFHMAAGGVFAMTLCILVALRVGIFSLPASWRQTNKSAKKSKLNKDFLPKNNSPINRTQAAAGWAVALAGFILVLTALILMTPLFSTEFNLWFTGLHRWMGLAALIAAAIYAYHSVPGHKKRGREQQ